MTPFDLARAVPDSDIEAVIQILRDRLVGLHMTAAEIKPSIVFEDVNPDAAEALFAKAEAVASNAVDKSLVASVREFYRFKGQLSPKQLWRLRKIASGGRPIPSA